MQYSTDRSATIAVHDRVAIQVTRLGRDRQEVIEHLYGTVIAVDAASFTVKYDEVQNRDATCTLPLSCMNGAVQIVSTKGGQHMTPEQERLALKILAGLHHTGIRTRKNAFGSLMECHYCYATSDSDSEHGPDHREWCPWQLSLQLDKTLKE
ncbi:MAG: hypothetical protein H0U76_18065 [Ktedonobacteraceae bacterium]|nr:hypothetical protein [Ktedonobacteraceae bacterium]